MSDGDAEEARRMSRRDLLQLGTEVGVGIAAASLLVLARGLRPPQSSAPENAPIQQGDRLVFAQGSAKGDSITVDRVPAGGPPVLAWPMDPKSNVVKSGRLLNLVLLVRAGSQAWYSPAESPRTASAVAAHSGTCTHLCCVVSEWEAGGGSHGVLLCPCHRSHFDPWDGGKALDGPAPRALPALPLTTDAEARLIAAGGFVAPPGCRG